jgi:RNA polymerase sigma-70 factor (ECF subfamily)
MRLMSQNPDSRCLDYQKALLMLEMNEGAEIFVDAMSEHTAAAQKENIVFDEAFLLHHRTVFRAARSVVQDAGLAEDVTQEVFLRLYNNLDSINDQEMLRPWLIRVAINTARNTLRGNIRANTREENYVKESADVHVYSVEDDFEEREATSEVRRALGKIREPLRSCLVLRQQGLSYREIAESLDICETSIGQYVARARKEFLRFYGKIGSDGK